MEKLIRIASIVTNVGKTCRTRGLVEEDLPEGLRAILKSLPRYVVSCLRYLVSLSDVKQKVIWMGSKARWNYVRRQVRSRGCSYERICSRRSGNTIPSCLTYFTPSASVLICFHYAFVTLISHIFSRLSWLSMMALHKWSASRRWALQRIQSKVFHIFKKKMRRSL